MPAIDYRIKFGGVRVNAIGVMSIFGMEEIYLVEDTVKGETFVGSVSSLCSYPLMA